jgi:uncharacterized protein YecE (DUF72 family)
MKPALREGGGMSLELWVGTSGYVFPDWVGTFYPEDMSSRQMLAYYSGHFPLVELNFTFYREPTPEILASLCRRAPPGFQFIVKLHRSLSHENDLKGAAEFRNAVDVMRRENRLLMLLCQYPQRFHHGESGLEQIAELTGHFPGYPMALEFRHRSWHRPDVADWLKERGLHLVSVDAPEIPDLYPSGLVQSNGLVYVRFHSRRGASWYLSEKERYDYLYSDEELRQWLDVLAARQGRVERALLLFNNCRSGQAAQNALRVHDLLESRPGPFRLVPPFPGQQEKQGLLF